MKTRKLPAFLLVFLLVFLLAVGCLPGALAAPTAVEAGEPAYDFTVTLLDGSPFTLSDYRGQVVFVNVWVSWCGDCMGELPVLQRMAEDYPDTLVILGVNYGEDLQSVQNTVTGYGLTYPNVTDETYSLIRYVFPTQILPYTVVIDPAGVVSSIAAGARPYDEFVSLYQEALANQPDPQTDDIP